MSERDRLQNIFQEIYKDQHLPTFDHGDTKSKYEIYDYKKMKNHWLVSGQYCSNDDTLNLMLPCQQCNAQSSPETRHICENYKNYKCLECDFTRLIPPPTPEERRRVAEEFGIQEGIYFAGWSCECSDVFGDGDGSETTLDEKLVISVMASGHYHTCKYICTTDDSSTLGNRYKPSYEFCEKWGFTDLYKEDDYIFGYFFQCLNSPCMGPGYDSLHQLRTREHKNPSISAEHMIFEVGDVINCPYCENPLTYFKLSDNGPFKFPEQYNNFDTYDKYGKEEDVKNYILPVQYENTDSDD